MQLKFTEQCSSTMTLGRENLFHKLNGIDADIFYHKPFPEGFEQCMDYIGGFTDSCFFRRDKIKELTEEKQKEFLENIKNPKNPKNRKELETVKIKEDKRTLIEKSNDFLN